METVAIAQEAEKQLIRLNEAKRSYLLGEGHRDPFELISVEIEGDVLVCVVSYPGGSARHSFAETWWQGFMESYPVQADVGLVHHAGGEHTGEPITETLRFDLTSMKETYRRAYQADHGSIMIGVRGFQKPTRRLRPGHTLTDRFDESQPEPRAKDMGVLYVF
jgi:hypothetical protein